MGQATPPTGLKDVVAIAAGAHHSLAVKRDGSVVAWGWNDNGQTNVPAGLSNVIAVAGGARHSLALKSDGTVVAWGDATFGATTVPAGLGDVIAIAAGYNYSLALKNDGTVVHWGLNTLSQLTVPTGLKDVVAIAAGESHVLALKLDGTIVAWGSNNFTETDVPAALSLAPLENAHGLIFPALPLDIVEGSILQYVVMPYKGYSATAGGTCGGALAGNIYTTNAINADCSITAKFTSNECSFFVIPMQNGKMVAFCL